MVLRWTNTCLGLVGLSCKHNGRIKKAAIIKWIVLSTIFVAFLNYKYNWTIVHLYKNANYRTPCMLPVYDPYDSRLSDYFHSGSKQHQCAPWLDLMYITSKGYLHLNDTAVELSKFGKVTCKYANVQPKNHDEITFSDDEQFVKPEHITADFIRVQCNDNSDKTVYRTILVNVNYGFKDMKLEKESEDKLSILIFGIDSLTGLIAKRKLPKTLNYLHNVLHAYTMTGYTKVAPNSYPNLIALLTGNSYDQLPEQKYVKTAPYLWTNFSKEGAPALVAEDYHMIATWNTLIPKPQHFMRDFFLADERLQPLLLSRAHEWLQRRNIDVFGKKESLCFGNKLIHNIMIDYFKRFVESYSSYRKFGFYWTNELLHDQLNLIGDSVDMDIMNFFKWLKESGNLKHTLLVLVGDHGPMFSEFQNTEIGRVSNLNPFLSLVVPEFIREKYPYIAENLLENTKALTTHFDAYETMRDIFHSDFKAKEDINPLKMERGISLFRKIPKTRSCFDAHIGQNYCPCYTSQNISTTDARLKPIAIYVISKINGYLTDLKDKCAKVNFDSIHHASLVYADMTRQVDPDKYSFRSYFFNVQPPDRIRVSFKTQPGNALFESTVEYRGGNDIKLLGEIDRINKYGKNADCVVRTHRIRRQFCYCI